MMLSWDMPTLAGEGSGVRSATMGFPLCDLRGPDERFKHRGPERAPGHALAICGIAESSGHFRPDVGGGDTRFATARPVSLFGQRNGERLTQQIRVERVHHF